MSICTLNLADFFEYFIPLELQGSGSLQWARQRSWLHIHLLEAFALALRLCI
jgi:hypothetical protein